MLGLDVGARVGLEFEILEDRLLRPEETHREQHELRGAGLFRARLFLRDELTFVVLLPLNLDRHERVHVAGGVADELFHRGEIDAGIGAELGGGLFLTVVHLVGLGPLGPGIVSRALERRLRENFDLDDALATVAHRGADAVGAGVAAADDDDVFVLGVNRRVLGPTIENGLGVGGEQLHREVHALERTAFDGEIARERGPGADDGRVVFLQENFGFHVIADVGVADEFDAGLFHQLDAAEDDVLFIELHVGDAIHEEAARTVGALEDRHGVAGLVELLGGGETRGTGADDGDFLARANLGLLGEHPALVPTAVGDFALDVLDRDGRVVDAEDAGAFARSGAHAAGELREVVRLVEPVEGFLPEPAVNEIVPLGDQVVDRAAAGHAADEFARMAERDAAVHAARALVAELFLLHVHMEFLPVFGALEGRAVDGKFAEVFDEAGGFAHDRKS